MNRARKVWLIGCMVMAAVACDKKDDPENPNEYVNNWIYDNLDFWYYWNTSLPSNPDKSVDPESFFTSLKNSNDRFSWIQEDYLELLNSLQGVSKEAGFEFVLYRESEGSNNLVAQILYVKPNSPASNAELKRGDVFKAINGERLTVDNYKTLLGKMGEPFSLGYQKFDTVTQQFDVEKQLALVPVEYAENPNFLHKIFTYDNHIVGYYMYNLFATGPTSSSTAYSDEMDQIFADFKAAGVTDLVVDLRYNSGGAETATRNLASLIGKGVNTSKVFAKRQYNADVTEAIIKDPDLGEEFLTVNFLSKAQNVGGQLNNSRVYILTGSRSASASELLINSLRPYMDVFLIGNKTVGKNVGSISIYEKDDPKNTWGMQPIVVKTLNSLDQSDYDTGFNPQILDADNSMFLYPLGDPKERLLNRALKEITGLADVGRTERGPEWSEEIGHSLDVKRRGNAMIVEPFEPRP